MYKQVFTIGIGILYCKESDLIKEENNDFVPNNYYLSSAYPTIFNSTSTISYGLPSPSNVSLQVYNLAGQQITSLFEGPKQPGVHTTTLNASNLTTGLYFVRLKASDQAFTQKIMLIR